MIAALQRLPRRQREVIVLRYWSELTEAQVADAARHLAGRRQIQRFPRSPGDRRSTRRCRMNTIDDRISAALHARAESLTADDLSPAAPPVQPVGSWPARGPVDRSAAGRGRGGNRGGGHRHRGAAEPLRPASPAAPRPSLSGAARRPAPWRRLRRRRTSGAVPTQTADPAGRRRPGRSDPDGIPAGRRRSRPPGSRSSWATSRCGRSAATPKPSSGDPGRRLAAVAPRRRPDRVELHPVLPGVHRASTR